MLRSEIDKKLFLDILIMENVVKGEDNIKRLKPGLEFRKSDFRMNIKDFNGIRCNPGKDMFLVVYHVGPCSGNPVVPDFLLSWIEVRKLLLAFDSISFSWTYSGIILIIRLLFFPSTSTTSFYLVHPGELDLPDGVAGLVSQDSEGWKEGVQFHGDVPVSLLHVGQSLEHRGGVLLRLVGLVGAAENFTKACQHPDDV